MESRLDGDGDNTRGNDGTGGGAWNGNWQGDGDGTRGNDGTSGGIDGDNTAGNDGTGGGNNTYVAQSAEAEAGPTTAAPVVAATRVAATTPDASRPRSEGRPCPRPPLFHVSTCRRLSVRSARG